MEEIGLLVTLEARSGKEADAEAFLKSAQPLALDEKATLKWYAIKLGPGKFGIFDTFANEAGRNAHLSGEIAKALTARASELFAVPPQVAKVEVLANTPLKVVSDCLCDQEKLWSLVTRNDNKEKEIKIKEKKMTNEKEMKISQTYRVDFVSREHVVSAPRPDATSRSNPSRLYARHRCDRVEQAAPPISGVIGKVQSFTGSSLDVQTPSGVVHVDVKQPLTTYKQIPSDLSHVTSASYVGVASTEQADGKEVAKQIIIFPPELSGAAEGSVLTDPPGATTHSRMTNGSVSRPAVSHSRMTNGTAQKGSGTTLVVQYQDGSQTISVPAKCPRDGSRTRTSHIRSRRHRLRSH